MPATKRDPVGPEVANQFNGATVPVEVQNINGKPHKPHVNGTTRAEYDAAPVCESGLQHEAAETADYRITETRTFCQCGAISAIHDPQVTQCGLGLTQLICC